ncbi:MAG: PAAR domain-containing protein [Lentisphaerae bacterium]|nr:PAAR domain-containing protein [Lentisphaerota bacterium]MBT4818640.1 PAAR domain-containing protein [Lentisphaerota bacterium]MBT5607089.1 PAAR domain-containing protein [Lentisphaerota bacterium]MBT7057196.1 PAAR domain-containing protein [Lentisphaerota bacterium]MBT7844519.1 PAAR domain-containing protein [Lentisphaerota bacterium]
MLPAARVGDMHACPMQTPGTPPIPHVGELFTRPGVPPRANRRYAGCGDQGHGHLHTGPPDAIAKGSATVPAGGRSAARMGDSTAHGGAIVVGSPTVLIGGGGSSSAHLACSGPFGRTTSRESADASRFRVLVYVQSG